MVTRARDHLLEGFMTAGRQLSLAVVQFHSRVAAREGLGPTDLKALDLLRHHDELTPRELGAHLGMAPASITDLATRLEARGLVTREQRADDRRRVRIRIAPEATARIQGSFDELSTALADCLDAYTDEEVQLITDAFRRIAEVQLASAQALGTNSPTPGS